MFSVKRMSNFLLGLLGFLVVLIGCGEDSPTTTAPKKTGTIAIIAVPDSIKAAWTIVGPDVYVHTGTGLKTLEEAPLGQYTVTWSEVAGYNPPAIETKTLAADSTITFTGIYVEEIATGTVEITSTPESLNAGWSLDGPAGFNTTGAGAQSIPDLVVGQYTVTWSVVAEFHAPSSETRTLGADSTLTFTGTYVEEIPTGTIEISSTPESLNAGWSLAGSDGYSSSGNGSESIVDLEVGDYTVTWTEVAGYVTPSVETQTLIEDATLTFTCTYGEEIATGTIEISSTPESLNAGWSLAGPDGYSSSGNGSESIVDLEVGDYTVTWTEVAGYVTPSVETQTLIEDATLTFTCTYGEEIATGTIEISSTPESLNAGWSLAGPDGYSRSGNGSETIADLEVGDYTVTWVDAMGYFTPSSENQTLTVDGSITFTGAYVFHTGTVVISPTPESLNAGWSLVGPDGYSSSGNGSETIADLEVGDYSVTWVDAVGYFTPSGETQALTVDATMTFTGAYAVHTGTVEITPTPESLNAGWSLAGPAGYSSSGNGSETIADLEVGDYTITWADAVGYFTPSSESQALTVDATITFTGVYAAHTGTVEITPTPESLNAGWSLAGPSGYSSSGNGSETIADLEVGDYTVTWVDAMGYFTPSSEIQTLTVDASITFTGAYVLHTGTVVISPTPESLNAGWSLAGPDGYSRSGNGSETIADLEVGDYTITWVDAVGYFTPSGETQALTVDATMTFTGAYAVHTGTVEITPTPEPLNAGWSLAGPAGYSSSGNGSETIADLEVGDYTITWADAVDYFTPSSETQALTLDATITFTGAYVVHTGTVEITPYPESLNAGWSLVGPAEYSSSGNGSQTFADMEAGDYTVTWVDAVGYFTPPNETQTLTLYETITFTGAFAEEISLDTVLIPPVSVSMPATFTMGSTAQENETPHQVTLTGRFDMVSTEVTNSQYVAVLQWAFNQGYATMSGDDVYDNLDGSTDRLKYISSWISFSGGVFSTSSPDRPVTFVTWQGAAAYCDWLSLQEGLPRAYDHSTWSCNNDNPYTASGYRLPTEAEWEFACRAGTTTHFNTGDCLDAETEASYDGSHPYTDCPSGHTPDGPSSVGSYPANQWGLYDMHGNNREWCNDRYGDYNGDETDPVGTGSDDWYRTVRGGSWAGSANNCRSAVRHSNSLNTASLILGFRPVRSTP